MSPIAAVVYGPEEDCDTLLREFARDLAARGVRVVGLVQVNGAASCDDAEMELEAVESGRRINICQDLGAGSVDACRLDPTGLAEAAGVLKASLATPHDLVVVNKFGRMEMEGGGLIAEVAEAASSGRPLVIGVPQRFLAAWDGFACGADRKVACGRAALEAWWLAARAAPAAA